MSYFKCISYYLGCFSIHVCRIRMVCTRVHSKLFYIELPINLSNRVQNIQLKKKVYSSFSPKSFTLIWSYHLPTRKSSATGAPPEISILANFSAVRNRVLPGEGQKNWFNTIFLRQLVSEQICRAVINWAKAPGGMRIKSLGGCSKTLYFT